MPRPTVPPAVHAATAELVRAVARLVDAARSSTAKAPGPRGPGNTNPKPPAAVKATRERDPPAQRAARIAKMLAGRGLKPKAKAKRGGRPKSGATIVRGG